MGNNPSFYQPEGTYESVTDLVNFPKTAGWNVRLSLARILFFPVLLGCIAVSIFWIVKTAIEYDQAQSNPYITTVTVHKSQRNFPRIAVCPFYPDGDPPKILPNKGLPTKLVNAVTKGNNSYPCLIINNNLTQVAKSTTFSDIFGFFQIENDGQLLSFIIDDSQVRFDNLQELAHEADTTVNVIPYGAATLITMRYVSFETLSGHKSHYFNFSITILVPSINEASSDALPTSPTTKSYPRKDNTTLFAFSFIDLDELQLTEMATLSAIGAVSTVTGFIGPVFEVLLLIDALILSFIIAGGPYDSVWASNRLPEDKYNK